MMDRTVKERLTEYCAAIEERLRTFTAEKPELQGIIVDAMEYSLMAGGKRLRPVLVLEFCRMCGGDADKFLDIACTLEMIHTSSLIHDDLPCMDDDDFRRGRPSCHKAFPENIALLAGDALMTLPYEVISDKALEGVIDAKTALMLISVLAKAVGTNGMIGGQVIDLQSEGKDISLETLNALQEGKTGALIEAACVMGVVLSGRLEKIGAAAAYASALGRAFQIIDDILDVTSTFEELGTLTDEPKLPPRAADDVMPYGVAMLMAQTIGDADHQGLFASLYNKKRSTLTTRQHRRDVLPRV